MRNMAAPAPGICPTCRGFIDPEYKTCYPCAFQPSVLDAVVPITYSEHLGQIHTALRTYKEGESLAVQAYPAVRLAAILWRFLVAHEECVAAAAGVAGFDLVTTVPSSSPQRDEHSALRVVADTVEPISLVFSGLSERPERPLGGSSARIATRASSPSPEARSCCSTTPGSPADTPDRPPTPSARPERQKWPWWSSAAISTVSTNRQRIAAPPVETSSTACRKPFPGRLAPCTCRSGLAPPCPMPERSSRERRPTTASPTPAASSRCRQPSPGCSKLRSASTALTASSSSRRPEAASGASAPSTTSGSQPRKPPV